MQAQGLVMVDLASDLFGHRGLPGSRSRKLGAPPGPVPGDTPTTVQRPSKKDAMCNSLTGWRFSPRAGRGPGLSRAKADTDCSVGDASRALQGQAGARGRTPSSTARPAREPGGSPSWVSRMVVSAIAIPGRGLPSLRNVPSPEPGEAGSAWSA